MFVPNISTSKTYASGPNSVLVYRKRSFMKIKIKDYLDMLYATFWIFIRLKVHKHEII